MADSIRFLILEARLAELHARVPAASERAIVESSCAAIEAELLKLGRALRSASYWRTSVPGAAGVARARQPAAPWTLQAKASVANTPSRFVPDLRSAL